MRHLAGGARLDLQFASVLAASALRGPNAHHAPRLHFKEVVYDEQSSESLHPRQSWCRRQHRVAHLRRRRGSMPRSGVFTFRDASDLHHRVPHCRRRLRMAEMLQQQLHGQDRRQRVRDSLAGNASGAEAVHRLEHARKHSLRIDVRARRQSDAPRYLSEDRSVRMSPNRFVAGHDDVERLRLADKVHRRGVDQQHPRFDVRDNPCGHR